jgi:hypothetical protein
MRTLAALTLTTIALSGACVTRTVVPNAQAQQTAQATGGVAATMTIERFLKAVNQNDIDTMASLFGTRDGSVTQTWTKKEIDTHMFLMTSILRHSDFNIAGEQIVPGRRDEATQYNVRMMIKNDTAIVPFTMVRSKNNAWLIENICLNRVTQRDPNANCKA